MSLQRFFTIGSLSFVVVACASAPSSCPRGTTATEPGTCVDPRMVPGPPAQAAPPGVPAASAACGLTPPADGTWSLREREQWAALMRQAQSYLSNTNERCGTQICVSIAVDTFRGHFAPQNYAGLDTNGADHVTVPINVVREICEAGAMQTNTVRARVQRIDIRLGGAGPSSWAFDRGVLSTSINPAAESTFDFDAQMRGPNGLKQRL